MQQFVRGVLESHTAKAKHVPQPPDATIAIFFAEVNNMGRAVSDDARGRVRGGWRGPPMMLQTIPKNDANV
jgi:hypothetical protein